MQDKSPQTLTTPELQRRAGVSRFQLKRWMLAGLLPAPDVVTSKTGRGRQGVWPASALDTARRLKDLTGRGRVPLKRAHAVLTPADDPTKTAQADAETLAAIWLNPKGVTPSPSELKERKQVVSELYAEVIEAQLMEIGITKALSARIAKKASKPEALKQALTMAFSQMCPVLLYHPKLTAGFVVAPDFLVSFVHSSLAKLRLRMALGRPSPSAVWACPGFITLQLRPVIEGMYRVMRTSGWPALPEPWIMPAAAVDQVVCEGATPKMILRVPARLGVTEYTRDGAVVGEGISVDLLSHAAAPVVPHHLRDVLDVVFGGGAPTSASSKKSKKSK